MVPLIFSRCFYGLTQKSKANTLAKTKVKAKQASLDRVKKSSSSSASSAAVPVPLQDAILIWDIENVRLPDNIDPGKVIMALKDKLMHPSTTSQHRSVACLTQRSLKAIQYKHHDFIDSVIAHMDVSIASHVSPKKNADYVLCREMSAFMDTHPRGSKIVLLTGDADFLEPVQRAIKLGFQVQLVYVEKKVSHTLLELNYGRVKAANCCQPIPWDKFLQDAFQLQADQLTFPYPPATTTTATATTATIATATTAPLEIVPILCKSALVPIISKSTKNKNNKNAMTQTGLYSYPLASR